MEMMSMSGATLCPHNIEVDVNNKDIKSVDRSKQALRLKFKSDVVFRFLDLK